MILFLIFLVTIYTLYLFNIQIEIHMDIYLRLLNIYSDNILLWIRIRVIFNIKLELKCLSKDSLFLKYYVYFMNNDNFLLFLCKEIYFKVVLFANLTICNCMTQNKSKLLDIFCLKSLIKHFFIISKF